MEVELLGRRPNAASVAGVCVSYVWQSLSDITEQLLAGPAANELTRIKLPRLNAKPQSYQIDV